MNKIYYAHQKNIHVHQMRCVQCVMYVLRDLLCFLIYCCINHVSPSTKHIRALTHIQHRCTETNQSNRTACADPFTVAYLVPVVCDPYQHLTTFL